MEKISEFISKKIVSINSGNIVGYVLDVIFDEGLKKLVGFLIVDDESEEVLFLDNNNIKAKGEDCFMIEDEDILEIYISSLYNNPIGKQVYTCEGVNLGKVTDVFMQGNQTKKLITTKCEFSLQYLRKAGGHCLIYGKKPKKNSKKVLFEVKTHLPKVLIQNNQENSNQETIQTPIMSSQIDKPFKLIASAPTIIGKIVTNDILGLNNEIIARKNDEITQKIINKAKLHNKFNLLLFYSK